MNEYQESVQLLQLVHDRHRHLDEGIDESVSPFVQQICYGVLRQWFYLGALVDLLVSKPLPAKHSDIRLLIMCGLYSIDELNRPGHASVNAAVETTRELGKGWASGLVNGVLRRYIREHDKLSELVTRDNAEARFNHPDWMIDAFIEHWLDNLELFQVNNSRPPMTLRVNLQKVSRDTYLEKLQKEGIQGITGELSRAAIQLVEPVPVKQLPGFREGLVSVQDEAPQLAAFLLECKPGERVLDACAAPGVKTCHLLECEPGIRLTAIDRDVKRIHLVNENLQRLSLHAEVIHTSLEDYEPAEEFDRILLDVPCSATGIMRRHPDIKLLRTKSDIDKLVATQRVLLNKAYDLLKAGGELLYSTCSILPEENDHLVASFLETRPDAVLKTLPASRFPISECIIETQNGIQFLPEISGHDGFFYALIGKTAT